MLHQLQQKSWLHDESAVALFISFARRRQRDDWSWSTEMHWLSDQKHIYTSINYRLLCSTTPDRSQYRRHIHTGYCSVFTHWQHSGHARFWKHLQKKTKISVVSLTL